MPPTDSFRKQHDEIIEELLKLEVLAKVTPLRAGEVAKQFEFLADKLNAHLAMEDQILYPMLLRSADSGAVETTKRFQSEMGGLKMRFMKFYNEWGAAKKISSNEARFLTQLADISAALKKRVAKENTELYPLADQI